MLFTYTIYDNPSDFPGTFVVRRFAVSAAGPDPDPGVWALAKDLDSARESIPAGLVCFDRQPGDDPVIVETWL